MRFVARKPREGINVSDTHPLAEAGTLVVGLSLLFMAVVLALVFIVELVLLYVSPETEAELFSNWTPDDLVSIVADDERLIETRALAARLADHWPDSPYTIRVEISDSEVPNAMALGTSESSLRSYWPMNWAISITVTTFACLAVQLSSAFFLLR